MASSGNYQEAENSSLGRRCCGVRRFRMLLHTQVCYTTSLLQRVQVLGLQGTTLHLYPPRRGGYRVTTPPCPAPPPARPPAPPPPPPKTSRPKAWCLFCIITFQDILIHDLFVCACYAVCGAEEHSKTEIYATIHKTWQTLCAKKQEPHSIPFWEILSLNH